MATSLRGFVIACALLLVPLLLALTALALWQNALSNSAGREADVERSRAVQQLVETQARADLIRRSELVADDAAFAGYVEMAIGGALPGVPVDTTSLVDLLREREKRLGFVLTAVLDQNGRVLGTTSALLPDGRREDGAVFTEALKRDSTVTGVWSQQGGLYHVAVVPLSAVGVSDGFLMTAVPLGQAYVDALASAGVDAALVPAGATVPTVTSAGSEVGRPALATRPAFGSALASVALRSRGAAAGAQALLPWALAALAMLGVAAFAAFWIWRRVFVPAALITDRLERAHSGDLHLRLAPENAGALAPLALAFNQLVERVRKWRIEAFAAGTPSTVERTGA